ncbi:MAG: geranylgeranyl reductase family protein [Gemmatimonadota bacterium]|nr:MAG: geranylgeranyl reductase family protein [Gemmatimonadota bacterium]
MTSEAVDVGLWDVVVVGAGPAGATAAAHLASFGHTVLLLDKHRFPRDKVCGDGLIPDALKSLRDLGLYETIRREGHCVDKIVVLSPSGIRVEIDAQCVTLKRRQLDKLIVDEAVARGATFAAMLVHRIRQDADGSVYADTADPDTRIHARLAILATGADVTLLEGLSMLGRRAPSGIAARCYVRSPVQVDELVVSFDRSIAPGYAWIFPLGGDEYNVGCGVFFDGRKGKTVNLRDEFSTFTSKVTIARLLMDRAESIDALRGARIRSGLSGSSLHNGGSVISIGEAVGATYPFTGEGVGKAMETGSLAALQVHAALEQSSLDPLRRFPSLVDERLMPRYLGYKVAQRWISRPWLCDLIAARIRSSRSLQGLAAGIINEATDPRDIFTWRTLLPQWSRRSNLT